MTTDDPIMTDAERDEIEDWVSSMDEVLSGSGAAHVRRIMKALQARIYQKGVRLPFSANTPYINTIPASDEPAYPGNQDLEKRIRSIIRWNAMAMVVRANRLEAGIGGHISTYASAATLLEVGFHHFFRGSGAGIHRDLIYFQGHASPGIYARGFLEGRITKAQMENFRRERAPGGGLSSYPHPWLMPHFWEFPTVSMGLGPIAAIYQARFMRYLTDRGLLEPTTAKVWAFIGDGETDEPETLGAINLASREKLDNLIFVINCNLQRLDGPVRGNGKIIQELEASFRGAGWNVVKVIWGADWDSLLEKDEDGVLMRRMEEAVDGEYQKYTVEPGSYIREHFFGKDPRLLGMVKNYSDEKLRRLRRGGHDTEKVYAAFKAAFENQGSPTVILAKTIKGYGLGESGEGKNITHQQKKLNEDELREFRTRFGIPVSDEDVAKTPFYRPPENAPEMKYMLDQRAKLGGAVPERKIHAPALQAPGRELIREFTAGTEGREVSTTMVFVRILAKLLRQSELGRLIVPIVPDEARTFGMEALFRQCGIYSHMGQLYEPVDAANLLYYREAKDGQILEEGITEAGALSSFIAAGCAYATYGINTIPFFIFYSMFGFQRVGDLIWAAADNRCKGFLMGATSGRTTLAGEGLQHQDGQSHLLAMPVPNLVCYDPAFAYELAVIIRDGICRMFEAGEDIFYYLTLGNENYAMPPMPQGAEEGILRGIYCYRKSKIANKPHVHLLGSGAIINQVIQAAQLLEDKFNVAAHVWSVTSYKNLYYDALECERENRLHPGDKPRVPYVAQVLGAGDGVFVAASDYVRALPLTIAKWVPGPMTALGTDGFGRSEARASLREFFEVDHRYITLASLELLASQGKIEFKTVVKAIEDLKINVQGLSPWKV